MVMKVWEISQAYKVFRGSVGSVQSRLDRHKNSDLGSEVGTVTGLNSTTCRLIESVALLTKSIVSRRPAHPMYPRLTHKRRASYGHAQGLLDWRLVI